ncbi:alpha-amylase family glycosyl hydrolase [Pedobacter sp. SYSU D00535]|uniref:alpha-amylase family glycosyl hydrolase n=1 Tax=Pedobacter sp. SYSU D00535 TaxID=2810308 RepID=UPI001A97D145|nr:alpha-amylase family glycosyl hydrolase [Pedobacter sp. SYSU D00535]
MSISDNNYLWWQTGVIYQIYPRSYQDSNGDGIGDLQGIIQRLDYLKWLGVSAVWLSPIFSSPMADFGYDISDYQNIHPLFGSLDDFDQLLEEVHSREMKLLLDLVPNHTSDQHPWFLESRSSKDNPKRDWYIWHDASPDGSYPNNWLAVFGGSAWEWDEHTQQYYYHGFLKEQPDLNWRNPEVEEAMLNMMRFWLDKGVDGFRVDVIWHIIKDKKLKNNPVNEYYNPQDSTYNQVIPIYSTDQPEVHDIVRKMREVIDSYDGRLLIGEIYLPIHRLIMYYGENNNEAHLPFNFQLISLPWNARQIAAAVHEYEKALPENGWPNWVLGNHDQSRIASRVGLDQARVAAMLLLTLRGTPTIYYGDEIGMRDVPIPAEEVQDPQGLNMPDKNLSRDPFRTPMQWDSSENSGFTTSRPWLRLDRAYRRFNVESMRADPCSILSLYKRLIEKRQQEPSLTYGSYTPLFSDAQVMAYLRHAEGHHKFLIVLNLTHRPCYVDSSKIEALQSLRGTIEVATLPELEGSELHNKFTMGGDEGILVRLRNEGQAFFPSTN